MPTIPSLESLTAENRRFEKASAGTRTDGMRTLAPRWLTRPDETCLFWLLRPVFESSPLRGLRFQLSRIAPIQCLSDEVAQQQEYSLVSTCLRCGVVQS
jgi:hypothetical protein